MVIELLRHSPLPVHHPSLRIKRNPPKKIFQNVIKLSQKKNVPLPSVSEPGCPDGIPHVSDVLLPGLVAVLPWLNGRARILAEGKGRLFPVGLKLDFFSTAIKAFFREIIP